MAVWCVLDATTAREGSILAGRKEIYEWETMLALCFIKLVIEDPSKENGQHLRPTASA